MTTELFIEKLNNDFIKDQKKLMVLGSQEVGNDYTGISNHCNSIFEMITAKREIIRE